MSPTVAFIAEGDANTADCWSGSGQRFVEALRSAGVGVEVFNAELRSWSRAVAAVLSYHPTRARWRQRYNLGDTPFLARTARVSRALGARGVRYDAVIQVGATFAIGSDIRRGAPHILYCDSNIAYSRRGAPYSAASQLSEREYRAAFDREAAIYESADRIWVMSDALGRSFRTDFGQPAHKIVTIYAGMNNPPCPPRDSQRLPRILFLGKDHLRKGSDILRRAFAVVRREIPGVELHMVGPSPMENDGPGVVAHGVLSRSTPAGRALLDELFGSSSVFCMPSRYEPFGIAFVEAMSTGLACVGTAAWAMPEIIESGKTGWLVPDGAVDELAGVLVAAIRDPLLCARMGELGRERAGKRFTWPRVAARAVADLQAILEVGLSERPTTVPV
jgi:glycosyltransferase involved in cell wall biosynthesis